MALADILGGPPSMREGYYVGQECYSFNSFRNY